MYFLCCLSFIFLSTYARNRIAGGILCLGIGIEFYLLNYTDVLENLFLWVFLLDTLVCQCLIITYRSLKHRISIAIFAMLNALYIFSVEYTTNEITFLMIQHIPYLFLDGLIGMLLFYEKMDDWRGIALSLFYFEIIIVQILS